MTSEEFKSRMTEKLAENFDDLQIKFITILDQLKCYQDTARSTLDISEEQIEQAEKLAMESLISLLDMIISTYGMFTLHTVRIKEWIELEETIKLEIFAFASGIQRQQAEGRN